MTIFQAVMFWTGVWYWCMALLMFGYACSREWADSWQPEVEANDEHECDGVTEPQIARE